MTSRVITMRDPQPPVFWTGAEWNEIKCGDDWLLAYQPYRDEPLPDTPCVFGPGRCGLWLEPSVWWGKAAA